jgi:hypothetical protein
MEEALGDGVVPTVAFAAHALLNTVLFKLFSMAGLRFQIAMMSASLTSVALICSAIDHQPTTCLE